MCGIVGILGHNDHDLEYIINKMTLTLQHRGPDDHGVWCDHNAQIALGHSRLSILDLSPAGHQPMYSHTQRYVIAFNGEIYNHLELRKELNENGYSKWKSHSDTETLLAGFEAWGIKKTLEKIVGMFAISLWDRSEKALYLARDRMGEKPLYYGFQNGVFLFASELNAIKQHAAFLGRINRNAIALQLRHNYIPDPWSIYEGIYKLSPGTYIKVIPNSQEITPLTYWSLKEYITDYSPKTLLPTDPSTAIRELEVLLKKTVQDQMLSDVPIGAFLSGGIDSSLVTALMQIQSAQPIKTFTIGFDQPGYNEAEYAKMVARHLKTEHTELYVTNQDALNIVPKLPTLYDEPFSDSSQIPTFLVSQMTKHHVSVALSGDGADELFGGYNRYYWADVLWKKFQILPQPIRTIMSDFLRYPSAQKLNNAFEFLSPLVPHRFRYKNVGDKLHKLSSLLSLNTREKLYLDLISHWKSPDTIVINGHEPDNVQIRLQEMQDLDFISQMMYTDTTSYLCGDILTKVDRASMGVSLETRAPFLDHRIVEAAWRLPLSLKIHEGQTKWILRKILYNYVPKELIERPKMGFGAPIGDWLRGPLRDWAEELLNEDRLKKEGYFNPTPIRIKWEEHLSKRRNWQYDLWDILMFQAWLEKHK